MRTLAVVIPYFQREAGVLRRALQSVFAQEVEGVALEIVIADDASPAPAEPETLGLSRNDFTISILKRPNGGPAAARNTALAAIKGADYIAFLDSDDLWGPRHIADALAALAHAPFYFADNRYDENATWFSGLAGMEDAIAEAEDLGAGLRRLQRERAMHHFIRHCLAHTSTVVAAATLIDGMRFDEGQAVAGEDYLFWLGAVERADAIVFNLNVAGARGRGVDLYRRALDWNHPECVRRLYYALLAHKAVERRFCHSDEEKRYGRAQVAKLRRSISYLLARNALRHPGANARTIAALIRTDPAAVALLPVNVPVTLAQKARGVLEFWDG